jgi:hydroxymethylpyrimidine pyrophosphatase-like HAD family hydrolase
MTIRLLVFDIDGVLTDGEARALDLPLLKQLAELNRLARQDASRPAVTVCTGRPAPYVEVLLQAIDGHLPGVYENGAGLYVPETYRFLPHPALHGPAPLAAVRRRLVETLVQSGFAYFQPGKEYSLTLFAANPEETLRLREEAVVALGHLAAEVDFLYSPSCLNILPRGMHKWLGIEFLASHSGYRPDEMLGVGDSDVDVPFLENVGYSAAPANANEAVRKVVQYVSPRRSSQGVRDILSYFRITG